MNKTKHYELTQWERSDRLLMADFNGDNAKVDAALAALQDSKADQTITDSLQTQVRQKADTTALNSAVSSLQSQISSKISAVTGSYFGNGSTQRISLGFTPKAVWFQPKSGNAGFSGFAASGFVAPGYPMRSSLGTDIASIDGTYLVVVNSEENRIAPNRKDTYYHFVAFR